MFKVQNANKISGLFWNLHEALFFLTKQVGLLWSEHGALTLRRGLSHRDRFSSYENGSLQRLRHL